MRFSSSPSVFVSLSLSVCVCMCSQVKWASEHTQVTYIYRAELFKLVETLKRAMREMEFVIWLAQLFPLKLALKSGKLCVCV